MEKQPLDESTEQDESFLKPKTKSKRTLTDEQRLVLAERMRAINDKRIADAMAKKKEMDSAKIEAPVKSKELKPRKIIKVVELSEEEPETDSESEEEVQYVVVPKKAAAKKAPAKKEPVKKEPAAKKAPAKKPKPQPVYESSEEDEAPPAKTILKPRKQKASSQPPAPEAPKILYRFL